MAITIPILTDFNSGGIDKALKKFNDLEGAGAKAGFAVRKAALPAAAALGVLSVAAVDSVKAAMQDQAAQEQLGRALDKTTTATESARGAVEPWISSLSQATAVADDQLRPALATLARGTGDLKTAQDGLKIALDASQATGKPLETVSQALSKAYAGNATALGKLDPHMKELIKNGASADEVIAAMGERFKGDATAAAQTAGGRFKSFGIAIDETKESIGAALMPAVEALLPVLQTFGQWAQEHSGIIAAVGIAIAGVASAILVANAALKVLGLVSLLSNPVGICIVAVAALVAGIIILWKKSEAFRTVVQTVWEAVKKAISTVADYLEGPLMAAWEIVKGAFNVIAGLIRGDFSQAWEGLKTAIGGVVDWIKSTLLALPTVIFTMVVSIGTSIVTGIASGVVNLASTIWDKITDMPGALIKLAAGWVSGLSDIGGKVIDWIKSGASGLASAIWDNISAMPGALLNKVGEWADDLKGIGGKVIGYIGDGLSAAAKGLGAIVKGALNAAIGALNKGIHAVNKGIGIVNKINPFNDIPNIPDIPTLAAGGIVTRPTLALIGEAGPEAVIPLNGRNAGMGVMTINVSAGLVTTPDQIGQQIIEAIQSAQRRSGPVFAPA